jgi:xanthine dehydrogenase accessory factor
MKEVVHVLANRLRDGGSLLVCQVVETRGSTPQKAGPWMCVDPRTGDQWGTLGGGCVEFEVKQKAIRRLGQPGAERLEFVLDHDTAWADGLICGGKMVILVEELRGAGPLAYADAMLGLLDRGEAWSEAVVIDPPAAGIDRLGARWLIDAEGCELAAWPAEQAGLGVEAAARARSDTPKPSVRQGIALLPHRPTIRLVIVGAGHVGQAVAALAAQVGFEICVVDDRSDFANSERFPRAREIRVGPIDQILPMMKINPRTYALIVSRGHGHDQEALYHLAERNAGYVGLIGSNRKIRMIFDSLREAGISAAALERVNAPVGLNIGSESVEEIAVSIVAQLIARRNLGTANPVGHQPANRRNHDGSGLGRAS